MHLSLPPFTTSKPASLMATLHARVLRHDADFGLVTLHFEGGELRVPMIDVAIGAGVRVLIDARDVSIALTRPMDVSITNRLPGTIVAIDHLAKPYVRVTFDLGSAPLYSLVTTESVERLALEPGLRAWAMIKSAAIADVAVAPSDLPVPRHWPVGRNPDRALP